MNPQLLQLAHNSAIAFVFGLLLGLSLLWLFKRTPTKKEPKNPAYPLRPTQNQNASQHITRQLQAQVNDAEHKHSEILQLLINLPDTINKIAAARSSEELCRSSMRAMMDLCQAQHGALFIFDPRQARYCLQVYTKPQRPRGEICFAPGEGVLGVLCEMVGVRQGREIENSTSPLSAADQLMKPHLSVTMRRHDHNYAFAIFEHPKQNDAMSKRVLQMIADVHAVSAEGVRALDQERMKADIDQLTQLYNRRYLDRRLSEELARARNYNNPLSVFMIDVDNFKNYNDTNGHQAGDVCLQMVARLARSVTRSSDVICRYGGEEFLVILLGADARQAWFHAERIRQTIASTVFPYGEKQPLGCVSISGGVASFPQDANDMGQLVKAADAALYQAKESGRNRVLLASKN